MKKFWLTLGLTLMLTCWCGAGYYGFGTSPAFGQDYYTPGLSCNPSDPSCYNDYYAAPICGPTFPIALLYRSTGRAETTAMSAKNPTTGMKTAGIDDRGHEDRGHQDHGQRN